METSDLSKTPATQQWIISLATSVVCCAVLFVIFASFLLGVKENIALEKMHIDMQDQRISELKSDLDVVRRHNAVQQIQMIPANPSVPVPEAVLPTVIQPPQAGVSPVPPAAPAVMPPQTMPPLVLPVVPHAAPEQPVKH